MSHPRRADSDRPGAPETRSLPAESTELLLARARTGDDQALEALFARYLPPLRRWASGRLPRWARDVTDTQDLVQETIIATFRRLQTFEPHQEGSLHAYLRQALMNRIRDELRKAHRRPAAGPIATDHPDDHASPLEQAIGREALERYESGLARLRPEEREAIVARVEMGLSYDDLALALGKSSRDAARMAVTRALVRLAYEMGRTGTDGSAS